MHSFFSSFPPDFLYFIPPDMQQSEINLLSLHALERSV